MKGLLKALFFVASALYPAIVFLCLVILKVPFRVFSLFIIFIGLVYLLSATGKGKFKENLRLFISAALLLTAGLVCFFTGSTLFIKLYPVLISGIFLFTFSYTLFNPPNICFRMACLQNRGLPESISGKRVEDYCRKVTLVWCVFFVLNGLTALATVFLKNELLWSVYNGGIAYVLMGILFTVEFIIRKVVNKKMPKLTPISTFDAKSRPLDMVMCYERKWSDGKYFTWGQFLENTAKLRRFIRSHADTQKWILHCDDWWYFTASLVALLQCKKQILLTANISPQFIAEIRSEPDIRFLTDAPNQADSDFLPELVENEPAPSEEEKFEKITIVPAETDIRFYTSGTTGHPKKVQQRLLEMERDTTYVIGRWGEEWLKRKFIATVSQHHIYGFLYYVVIPFTLGIPCRRYKIEFPEEFEPLDDVPYAIIAVPAFLKRTNASREGKKLNMVDPFIFTSGGLLTPEVAKETNDIFGYWPWEGYGSTETGAIAYRQSKNGLNWHPIPTATIWKNEEGCLAISSPYIQNPKGVQTGDLVDIMEDGSFILKGRADSIVKIEEKRISVTEVETRLMESGLVKDCAVVPMSDRRQYLAAAVVLNDEGTKKFADTEKYLINRHFHDYLMNFFENVVLPKKWRFLDEIPVDSQGKKKKPVIQALFVPENPHGIPAETILSQKEGMVELEVSIPASSNYFDGHFPEMKLLPAVAQIDLVTHYAQRYFGTELSTPDIKRFKFSNKILPDSVVVFHLEYKEEKECVTFNISDFSGNKVYASGSYSAKVDKNAKIEEEK